ncbi:hypothetical protein JCM10213_004459 [Rhodosporidiobolus nylandii]
MTTVLAVPLSPIDNRHTPILSTIDPSFSPNALHLQPYTRPSNGSPTSSFSASQLSFTADRSPRLGSAAVPMGSRFEKVPHQGPGTAIYTRKPTRAQLRENNSVFGSPNRPFYYKDPEGKPFIDADGKECGDRWIYVDPKAKAECESSDDERGSKERCCIM